MATGQTTTFSPWTWYWAKHGSQPFGSELRGRDKSLVWCESLPVYLVYLCHPQCGSVTYIYKNNVSTGGYFSPRRVAWSGSTFMECQSWAAQYLYTGKYIMLQNYPDWTMKLPSNICYTKVCLMTLCGHDSTLQISMCLKCCLSTREIQSPHKLSHWRQWKIRSAASLQCLCITQSNLFLDMDASVNVLKSCIVICYLCPCEIKTAYLCTSLQAIVIHPVVKRFFSLRGVHYTWELESLYLDFSCFNHNRDLW